jgi:hypothetical protein
MKQPLNSDQEPSRSNKTTVTIVLVLLGAGLLVLITLATLALGSKLQLQPGQVDSALPSTAITPTLFIPTPDCGSATLVLGSTTFQMQDIQLTPDGSVSAPADGAGTAYWVEGTDLKYIFMLSPTPGNISLISSLPAGSVAKATWSNCNSMTFTLSASQPGSFGVTYLPEQSTASIAIFIESDAAGNGFVVNGEFTE